MTSIASEKKSKLKDPLQDADLYYYLSSKIQEKFYSLAFNEQAHSFKGVKIPKSAYSKFIKKSAQQIVLKPDLKALKNLDWERTVVDRKSTIQFTHKALKLQQLSTLLTVCCGYKKFLRSGKQKISGRTFPSAGGRYSLEFYILALNIDGLKPGLYHYNAEKNSLVLLRQLKEVLPLKKFWAQEKHFKNASALIFTTSILEKSRAKYGRRALRYILMEAGSVGMHMNLLSAQLGMGFCFDGGGFDGKIEELLGIDGLEQGLISNFVLGALT